MIVTKATVADPAMLPFIAALPYRVIVDDNDTESGFTYNPETQISVFAGRRDFSTCREDESVWSIFSSKSDTKKDD